MSNPQIPLEARQTILDLIIAGQSFTAYEVTLEVRRRLGPGVDVPHPIVNGVVQEMFSRGQMVGYDRTPDRTISTTNPPFRYALARNSGSHNAPVAPLAPVISRAGLPAHLRFNHPVRALMRALILEARDLHTRAGKSSEPFSVWFPTQNDPFFRVRSYGAVPSDAEILARTDLSDQNGVWAHPATAFCYANEFQIRAFRGHKVALFKASVNAPFHPQIVLQSEVGTREPDGLEIEIPVPPHDITRNHFGQCAPEIFAYLEHKPRFHNLAQLLESKTARPAILSQGTGFCFSDATGAVLVVDEQPFALRSQNSLPSSPRLELHFAPGELDFENGDALLQDAKTRAAIEARLAQVWRELGEQLQNKIASAPDIWAAKCEIEANAGWSKAAFGFSQGNVNFEWRGHRLNDSHFASPDGETEILQVNQSGVGLKFQKAIGFEASSKTLVLENDIGTRRASPNRLKLLLATRPEIEKLVVLKFASSAARRRFFEANAFDSVPLQKVSELPRPATAKQLGVRRPLRRKPFDPQKHLIQKPQNPILNGDFSDESQGRAARKWAGEAVWDGQGWADFKRLYKSLETQILPDLSRDRWQKSPSELPPLSSNFGTNHALLLGALIARLEDAKATRGAAKLRYDSISRSPIQAVSNFVRGALGQSFLAPPSPETVAYLTRRAERLIAFLKEADGSRRDLLEPIVFASLLQKRASQVEKTFAGKLNVFEQLEADSLTKLWEEAPSKSIAKRAFELAVSQGLTVAVSWSQVEKFWDDTEFLLQILPPFLERESVSPARASQISVALQSPLNLASTSQRLAVLRLLSRFPVLPIDEKWVWRALEAVDDSAVIEWAKPLVARQAQSAHSSADFAVLRDLTPALQRVWLEAFENLQAGGISVEIWSAILPLESLIPLLSPTLQRLPLSYEGARFLLVSPSNQSQAQGWLDAMGAPLLAEKLVSFFQRQIECGETDWLEWIGDETDSILRFEWAREALNGAITRLDAATFERFIKDNFEYAETELQGRFVAMLPRLREAALSAQLAQWLAEQYPEELAIWRTGFGDSRFDEALAPWAFEAGKRGDLEKAKVLSPALSRDFLRGFGEFRGENWDAETWRELMGALPENADFSVVPDGQFNSTFWGYWSDADAQTRGRTETILGDRFARLFGAIEASEFLRLLENGLSGAERWIEGWLQKNRDAATKNPRIFQILATSPDGALHNLALGFLRERGLDLALALQLFESGFPPAQELARDFLRANAGEEIILALCDSPQKIAREFGLELLRTHPETALWPQLAQHDDPQIRATVAAHLEETGREKPGFERAILNSRGAARAAKSVLQSQSADFDLETLLEAARNGAPRDKAWALQQLVKRKLKGESVPELSVTGAFARESAQ